MKAEITNEVVLAVALLALAISLINVASSWTRYYNVPLPEFNILDQELALYTSSYLRVFDLNADVMALLNESLVVKLSLRDLQNLSIPAPSSLMMFVDKDGNYPVLSKSSLREQAPCITLRFLFTNSDNRNYTVILTNLTVRRDSQNPAIKHDGNTAAPLQTFSRFSHSTESPSLRMTQFENRTTNLDIFLPILDLLKEDFTLDTDVQYVSFTMKLTALADMGQ